MNRKTKKDSYGGWGLYVIFILAFVAIALSMNNAHKPTTITKAEFEVALEKELVKSVRVTQNPEVPTGNLTIIMKDETTNTMYVSDVNEMQDVMEGYGFNNFYCTNVPQKSWVENLLPYLLIFGACFIFFMIMTNNAAQQRGSDGKMANFGKSRAKLTTDKDKKVNFQSVAGLKE